MDAYDFEDGSDLPMSGVDAVAEESEDTPKVTPRKRGRPPKSNGTPTPKKHEAAAIQTPEKGMNGVGFTPLKQAADRSARRKSVKAMIRRTVGDEDSDEADEADHLAREIYGSSDEEDLDGETSERATTNGNRTEDDETASVAPTTGEPDTPSRASGRKPRRKRAKSPTPPRDLPPHELYFLHNKPGRPKTSDNTLESLALLSHDEYFALLQSQEDPHHGDVEYLESLHFESFPQWTFELRQGFSICLYGYGSKRALMTKFAKHIYEAEANHSDHLVIIINGYAPTTTIKEILNTIRGAMDPTQRIPQAQPAIMAQSILSHLSTGSQRLTLIVNSIDAPALRKASSQAILAQLAAHPSIQLICSADTPDFPLLWDIGVRSAFNFVFHDSTTFAPFQVELDVIDEVHELLGRKARRVNGREGVAFVLRSLPENARNLFQLIVGEVLIAMEDDDMSAEEVGIEYKMVYNKAEEEFICSSEMAFRTLLKEFHDHQIITSRKDAFGTELLSLPFGKDELEAILEDLMS
ncbi:hypothetical protein NLU13_9447 [Sarocladium strictum]|uniref:Origin recognition complex subunit 2 n=1 Tax=Sarocladium strictum TaxID=5046 RepID=A0AA39L3V5_SARSR|nr:hypothetical protein NLU13_9447 [Sarocladium strictum]